MPGLEEVQRDLEQRRADAPVRGHDVVDVAVDTAVKRLGAVAPGRAVLVRRVWSGTQEAKVMVSGASASQVARARADGAKAGADRMKKP